MKKGGDVTVIEGKEVQGIDPMKYLLPMGAEVGFESQRG